MLSNLGQSYLLSKDLAKAEEVLRRAHKHADEDRRIRMNLAVVLALQGHVSEAESIVKADRPVDEATASLAELKRLLLRKEAARSSPDRAPVTANARSD